MANSGEWPRKTCMHGIKEGLDSHNCIECQMLAQEMRLDMSSGRTYLFQSDPRLKSKSEPPQPFDLELLLSLSTEEALVIQAQLRGYLSSLATVSVQDDSEYDNLPLSSMQLDEQDGVAEVTAVQNVLKRLAVLFGPYL